MAITNKTANHLCAGVWTYVFNSLGQISRSLIAGFHGKNMLSFVKNYIVIVIHGLYP